LTVGLFRPAVNHRAHTLVSLLALLAVLGWWLLLPTQAAAHANLSTADPAPNSELETAPGRIIIWFTEPIEPGLSDIRVLDASGSQVDLGDSVVDDLNPLAMSVGLGDVPDGTYTVAWKNVSTVDGHRVRGSFVFAVGQPLSGSPVQEIEQPLLQSPVAPVLRWLTLLGALTMAGGLVFELLVTRPVLFGLGSTPAMKEAGRRISVRSLGLTWLALALFLGASVGQLLVLAVITHEVSSWGALPSALWNTITATGWGEIWVWRMVAAVAFGVVLYGLRFFAEPRPELYRTVVRTLAIVLGGAVLWTLGLTSHGAATIDIRAMALTADFLHLAASAFWIGALFHFVMGLSALIGGLPDGERRECLAEIASRFSVVAALSVATIIVTGVFSGWAQVTVVEALTTPYGITLIAKIALVLPLLFLGALNLFWVRPRLRREDSSDGWLKRLLIGEAVLAALILAVVGMLTALEPARQVASRELAESRQSISFSDTVSGDAVQLEVSPGRVGSNDLTVSLTDRLGRPISDADEVLVRLVFLESDLGDDTLAATSLGDGRYVREDAQLSIAGVWQAELVVRRPDAFDARTAFRFEALSTGATGSAAISPSPETAYLLLGAGLLVLGVLFVAAGMPLGGWFSRAGAGVMTPGVVGAVAGLMLLFNAQLGIGGDEVLHNPFPPTPDSLETGAATYIQVCQACHGEGGRGDGPAGAALDPPPADLVIHVPLHPESDLFRFIRDGIPGTGMAPLGGQLSEEQTWHVVNYIRTLDE
jgi:copper transport protein